MNDTATTPGDPLDICWFLPTYCDGRWLDTDDDARPPEFGYLREIATAIDRLGFGGVLLPIRPQCVDGWTYASALAPLTERLRFLVALRPSIVTPAMAARQATAFDRISDGQLLLNVVIGGDPSELAVDGQYLPHDKRYAQCAEFLGVWRALLGDEPVDFDGCSVSTRQGALHDRPIQRAYPQLWFGGSSLPPASPSRRSTSTPT